MKEDKGILFFYDWYEPLCALSDADFRNAIGAIISYNKTGIAPNKISPMADMALAFILPQIDRLKESIRIGKTGGRPKKDFFEKGKGERLEHEESANCSYKEKGPCEKIPSYNESSCKGDFILTEEYSSATEESMIEKAPSEHEDFTKAGNEKKGSKSEEIDKAFEEFWQEYPKKVGKGYAKQCYKKIMPSSSLIEKILTAVKLQKASESRKRENGKFIPNPSTWLNQERWDDTLSESIFYQESSLSNEENMNGIYTDEEKRKLLDEFFTKGRNK